VGLHGGVAGDLEQSEGLDVTVAGLGDRLDAARQNFAGGVLGVDGVALAGCSALALARGAADLDDLAAVTTQEPSEPDAVRTRALDTEGDDVARGVGLGEQVGVPVVGRRDEELSEGPPSPSRVTAACSSLWVSTPTMTSVRASAMLAMAVDLLHRSTVARRIGRADRTAKGPVAIRLL
jgi:hypothetical protein